MKLIPTSLRWRIILVFSLYSLILAVLMVGSIFFATRVAEEYSLKKRLVLEAEQYIRGMKEMRSSPMLTGTELPIPSSPYMTLYYGEELLPKWAGSELYELEPGEYKRTNEKQRYHIAIRELPDGERFYLLYNVTTIDSNREHTVMLRRVLVVTILPVGLFGLFLGLMTAHKSISPVVRLVGIVRKSKEDNVFPENFSSGFQNDEIGLLAQTLEHAIEEMQSSLEREKAFARDASHELRTPVTTTRGALELLKKSPATQNEHDQKLLGRIDRASSNMEHLIQSFLWLSRQERELVTGECFPHEVVQEVIESHAYLIRNREIDIVIEKHTDNKMPVAPQILSILISNLLRNALLYTQEGQIAITINNACISVKDSGMGIEEEILSAIRGNRGPLNSKGFGFGLSIVQRLCSYLGWSMDIESQKGAGTLVTICHCAGSLEKGCSIS